MPPCDVQADPDYDPPGNVLKPGAVGRWPYVSGPDDTPVDLRHPLSGGSCYAYLSHLEDSYAILRRGDGLGIQLSWDPETFPHVRLWEELGGTRTHPWYGRGRVVGIEPMSTVPGTGIAAARTDSADLVTLRPAQARTAWVRLSLFP